MKNTLFTFLLLVMPLILSCSQEGDGRRNTLTGDGGTLERGDAVVQSSNGSLYSVGCLQSSASAIQQNGVSALSQCQVSLNSGTIQTESTSRGKFFSNSYANVYYPPTYYNPSYNSYYYGSNYNCYNDTRFKNDAFCGFVFGQNSSFNCYFLFGFNNQNYSSYQKYYNPVCVNTCVYSSNPASCKSSCYHQVPVYYY